nr:NADPH-dependent assimilatory sulfite reductase hemoprotein subunit [uncultured Holophaga sp.]
MPSPIETIKASSNFLRGNLPQELTDAAPGFSPEGEQLIKLHGFYAQKHREHKDAPPTAMGRGRIPGGRLSAAQYLVWDSLATQYGDGTLRFTTRQCIELHGLAKADMRAVVQALHVVKATTQGACGDVVRNVLYPANPTGRPEINALQKVAEQLSTHFLSRAAAYQEIWLEAPPSGAPESEPLMGSAYLPRKFKIALTLAGEDTLDVLSNDLGLAATLDASGAIEGWFVFAGGGQSMNFAGTAFPRLASLLGWVEAKALLPVAEALLGTFRDHGDRENRKRARLKYVLHDRGVDWARSEVETRAGICFTQRPLPPWQTPSSHGWQKGPDGTWALGLSLLCGRIEGELKGTLRRVLETHPVDVQLTAEQDLVLLGVPEAAKAEVSALLGHLAQPSPLWAQAVACIAQPLCAFAITEGERALPAVLADVEHVLADLELTDRAPVLRLTGCPNGCARPHAAEIGLIGQGIDKYALYLGGKGDRLAFHFAERVPRSEIGATLRPLLTRWKTEGQPGETFGDFAMRCLQVAP